MSTSPNTPHFLSGHTFGRDHRDPPPLPSSIQLGQPFQAGQMGGGANQTVQMHAGGLPHDFDHLVRSVGEW